MRTIHFTIGAPGSGKTTYANQLIRLRGDVGTVHLDGIRSALFGSKRAFWDNPTPERREFCRAAYVKLFNDLMKRTEWDVVLPNTNADPWFYEHARHMASQYGSDLKIILFDQVTLEELLERNRLRCEEDRLKEEVLLEYWEKMISPDRYWKDLNYEAR